MSITSHLKKTEIYTLLTDSVVHLQFVIESLLAAMPVGAMIGRPKLDGVFANLNKAA